MTIVKQQHKLDDVSYHKLFDILKKYQNEVNELRAKKLAMNANPLALVATAQASQDPFYQSSRHKGKEIAKPITPPSETASKEDSDPEQAQKDKDMQKNLALIAKYFKKIYKPTNNNLRTSSNSKNKNVDMTLREKDSVYHKEKMLLCKKAEQGVPLQAEHYDWLADADKEVDEQELEAHYSYMAKIQEVPTADSGTDSKPVEQVQDNAGYNLFGNHLQHSEQSEFVSNTCLVETDNSNVTPDSLDMCEDDIQNDQNDVESDDERVALANLITILKLDVDENKKIQNQLKKANTILAQELKECKTILAETSKSLGESISVRDSCLVALQTNQAEFEKFKAFNDRTIDYDKLERKLNEALGQLAHKDTVIKEGVNYKLTISRPPLKSNQSRDKVLPNNSQLKAKKTQVEVHPRIPSVSNKIKVLYENTKKEWKWWIEQQSPSGYNWVPKVKKQWVPKAKMQWVPKAKNENVQKRFTPILGYGDLVQGNITINRVYYVEGLNHNLFSFGQFCNADLEVAFQKSKPLLEIFRASDYDNFDPVPQPQNVSSSADAHVLSQQELDLLFGPLYDEFSNAGSNPQDKQPTTNIQPTSAPSTPIYVHVEENNDNQAEEENLPDDEFTNPLCTPAQEVAECSLHNIGNSNVP
nr:integrase, catalytic region, zinc finger, CCHC-type, peptidase aspartic, catalytic [Tanacetum cinerariifolium]